MGRYGLNTIKDKKERAACMEHISGSMQAFQNWSCETFRTDRPADFSMQAATTFDGTRQRVHEYLGFVYHFQRRRPMPSLQDYLDAPYFAEFMAFLGTRNVDKAGHLKVGGKGGG